MRWSEAEVKRLKRVYLARGFTAACEATGRSKSAVSMKLWRLGLTLADTPHGVLGPLVGPGEVATLLNVNVATARRWVQEHPQHVRRGQLHFIPRRALDAEQRARCLPDVPGREYMTIAELRALVGETGAESATQATRRGRLRIRTQTYRPPGERPRLAYHRDDVAAWRVGWERRRQSRPL